MSNKKEPQKRTSTSQIPSRTIIQIPDPVEEKKNTQAETFKFSKSTKSSTISAWIRDFSEFQQSNFNLQPFQFNIFSDWNGVQFQNIEFDQSFQSQIDQNSQSPTNPDSENKSNQSEKIQYNQAFFNNSFNNPYLGAFNYDPLNNNNFFSFGNFSSANLSFF